MDFACNFPFFSIMLLMFTGIISMIAGPRPAKILSLAALGISTVLSALLIAYINQTGESFIYMMGHFPAPFGNEISAGMFEAVMAFGICGVAFLSLWGNGASTKTDIPEKKRNLYYIMMDMLMASLLVLIYTNDIFTAYVFVELNTIAACAIVMSKPGGETIAATIRYLIMSLLGSGLFLLGISLIYALTGHLLMPNMHEIIIELVHNSNYTLPLIVIVGLFGVSMAIKSALFPFHSWLPDAHGSATTASSAVLSGLVLKGYIILLIKLFFRVFSLDILKEFHISDVLLVLGLLGMIMGSVKAIKETNIKRMIAYSSVAQIGYIFMGIGMDITIGLVAAVFQILVHMVTKPMLFTAAGGLINVSGHKKDFESLQGSAWKDPLAGVSFIVGSLSMIGIPLFAGFIVKYYLAAAAFDTSKNTLIILAVLVLSTVLNALYYVPAISKIYHRDEASKFNWQDVLRTIGAVGDFPYQASLIIFIILNIILGTCSGPVFQALEMGLDMLG